jgi:hypothetical protein
MPAVPSHFRLAGSRNQCIYHREPLPERADTGGWHGDLPKMLAVNVPTGTSPLEDGGSVMPRRILFSGVSSRFKASQLLQKTRSTWSIAEKYPKFDLRQQLQSILNQPPPRGWECPRWVTSWRARCQTAAERVMPDMPVVGPRIAAYCSLLQVFGGPQNFSPGGPVANGALWGPILRCPLRDGQACDARNGKQHLLPT